VIDQRARTPILSSSGLFGEGINDLVEGAGEEALGTVLKERRTAFCKRVGVVCSGTNINVPDVRQSDGKGYTADLKAELPAEPAVNFWTIAFAGAYLPANASVLRLAYNSNFSLER
jgi:hypothetical protein